MKSSDKTKEQLLKELEVLQRKYDSIKELYEKDTRELKLEVENISKNEEKFRKAYMTSPDSININRLSDGMFISINEGFTRIMGYAEEDIIGKTSVEMNIWANLNDRSNIVKELTINGEAKNFEAEFIAKDGTVISGLMSASIIDFDGVPHILNVTRDITQSKRSEEALVRERYLMEAIMNNLPDHVYFKDRDSRFIRINREQAKMFGLNDPSEATGKTDFDFFTEEHARNAYNDEQEIIRTGHPLSVEEKETWEDRPPTWVSTVKMALYDHSGKIVGTFGISRDVTSRKKAEDELAAERNLLRTLIDNMPDRIYAKDLQSRFIIFNDALMKRMGKSNPEEIIGKTDFDLLPEELATRFSTNEQEIIRSGKPMIDHEESMRTISGKCTWSLTTKVPLLDAEGKIYGIVGVGKDITDRKRNEMESQVMYEIAQGITTSDNLDELMKLIHQSLGKVVYAKNCFVALHDEKTGLFSFPYFVDKYDPVPSPMAMERSCTAYVFRNNKPFFFSQETFDKLVEQNEVELIGSPSPSWIGIPLRTPSKVIGVLVLQHYERDDVYTENDLKFLISVGSQIAISIERKKSEEEIKLRNELLQVINAEKDKFFSILAHDLRGPLSSFVAATQIITEEIQSMTLEEIRDITMSMKNDATNIYSLLENLLEWSRLKRNIMEFTKIRLNVRKKIESCLQVLSEMAKKKEIEINVSVQDDLEVEADDHMFDTIIRNLISNAIKFTRIGGKINITAFNNQDNSIKISIRDTGIGIPAELQNKLFMLNEKTSRKGTEDEPSSGLGLLLCKEFIEKHEGRIWVESEEGKGSTFSLTIPV
jgi:PAS domain S-box-containing protein